MSLPLFLEPISNELPREQATWLKKEKIVKKTISDLMVYVYYNITKPCVLRIEPLLEEIELALFWLPENWTQPDYFNKAAKQVRKILMYVTSKCKFGDHYNVHVLLLKIEKMLKSLNPAIVNQGQLMLLSIWIEYKRHHNKNSKIAKQKIIQKPPLPIKENLPEDQ